MKKIMEIKLMISADEKGDKKFIIIHAIMIAQKQKNLKYIKKN